MNDQEARSALLALLYAQRAKDWVQIGRDSISSAEAKEEVRIAEQLRDSGLIELNILNRHMGGLARILGPGVDVMEGNRQSPIAITIDRRQTINVSGSTGIQIGDGSTQIINNGIAEMLNQIQQSPGTSKEKEDAKSLLRQFLEHPVVAAIVGGSVGLIK